MELETANPYTSPDAPWHKFPCLHPKLANSLLKQGFLNPTQIQAQTLADYPHHNDFLIASMTVSILHIK